MKTYRPLSSTPRENTPIDPEISVTSLTPFQTEGNSNDLQKDPVVHFGKGKRRSVRIENIKEDYLLHSFLTN